MSYKPPFKITNNILLLIQDISKSLGFLSGAKLKLQPTKLRKSNKIKTIQSSLAIEGNNLTIDQITAVLLGKRVLAPKKDIIEVQNAIKVYEQICNYNPLSLNDFLNSHKLLLQDLAEDNGKWRSGNVGIMRGNKVVHIAPKAKKVNDLMLELFDFLKSNKDVSWLIKACVFHYELELIHPFSDGNGRMGRLWQQIILMKEDKIFEYIPIEALIKDNQEQYYKVLGICDNLGESTLFVEFMLEQISHAIGSYNENILSNVNTPTMRLEYARDYFINKSFSRKEYILLHKNISTATASRDLKYALDQKKLQKIGDKNQSIYRFI